jgi:hypothetical protein
MINRILKVEIIAKMLLRIGIAIYMWSIVILSFKFDKDNLWMALIMVYLVIVPGFSLLHFRNPKFGLIGAIGTGLFFLASALVLTISDFSSNVSWPLIYLHVVKDVLLLFGSFILVGESLKEVVREKITAPFPKS